MSVLHHIAIICSSESSIGFYRLLGFCEKNRISREKQGDIIVFMEGCGTMLELFIDPRHPQRLTEPEALGLRHFALETDRMEELLSRLGNAGFAPGPVRTGFDGKRCYSQ